MRSVCSFAAAVCVMLAIALYGNPAAADDPDFDRGRAAYNRGEGLSR